MAVNEQGHKGQYSGNSRHSYNHANTEVNRNNYGASVKDDAAHIHYLKMDIMYDDHHGHNDEKMTADEKHISKLAGDMKYDKKHHGPADFQGNLHAAQMKHSESGEHLGMKPDAPAKMMEGPAKVDSKKLKEIAGQLRQASAMHKGQAKKIDAMIKSMK
jgi:hypothetical protein